MTSHEVNFSTTVERIRSYRQDPDKLIETYQKSVQQFDERDYSSSLRTIRVCLENFSKDIFVNAFPEKDMPEGRERIRSLEQEYIKTPPKEVYEIIGEQLETAYQIACKASHDDPYEITEGDAAVAHHLFARCVFLFHDRILHHDPR